MRIDTPENMNALQQILPMLAWGLNRLQTDIAPDTLRMMGERSRASVLHDLVFEHAAENRDSLQGIRLDESKGLRYFRVNGDINVRLNRGEKDTFYKNVNRNRQTRSWNEVPPNGLLEFGVLPDPNVNFSLVYVPDEFWSKLGQAVIGIYVWDRPTRYRELDLESWYRGLPAPPQPIQPTIDRPALRLKPSIQKEIEGLAEDADSGS